MHRTHTLLALVTIVIAACGGETSVPAPDAPADGRGPVAQTTAGELEGVWVDEAAGISVFRGVPFSRPRSATCVGGHPCRWNHGMAFRWPPSSVRPVGRRGTRTTRRTRAASCPAARTASR